MENGKSLIIWLIDGQTLKFENVTNVENTCSELKFDYFGISTQANRSASFNPNNIAGVALEK